MAKLARDVMTWDPACCSPGTTLDQVAKLMVQNHCGEIPIVWPLLSRHRKLAELLCEVSRDTGRPRVDSRHS